MNNKIRIRLERMDSYSILDAVEVTVELQTVEEARDAFGVIREIVNKEESAMRFQTATRIAAQADD